MAALVAILIGQQGQVSWIWPVGPATAGQIFAEQYFPSVYSAAVRAVGPGQQRFTAEQLAVAMQAWVRVVPLISLVDRAGGAGGLEVASGGTAEIPSGCTTVGAAAATWILAPTAVLVGYSVFVRPLYQPHYLAFTTPAVALLIGLGVVVVGRDRRRIGVILALLSPGGGTELPRPARVRTPSTGRTTARSPACSPRTPPPVSACPSSTTGADSPARRRRGRPARPSLTALVDVGVDAPARQRDSLFGNRLSGGPSKCRPRTARRCGSSPPPTGRIRRARFPGTAAVAVQPEPGGQGGSRPDDAGQDRAVGAAGAQMGGRHRGAARGGRGGRRRTRRRAC